MPGNPMLQTLYSNKLTQNMGSIKNMMGAIASSGNPQMLLNQIASQNPMLSQVMQIVQQNGGDARAAFYKLAQERGIDPNSILSQIP